MNRMVTGENIAWRKPLDNSYRGLRTKLRKGLRGVVSNPFMELVNTGSTVVLSIYVRDDLEIWITSPLAWQQVADDGHWQVDLIDVGSGDAIFSTARKNRDDEWIIKSVKEIFNRWAY